MKIFDFLIFLVQVQNGRKNLSFCESPWEKKDEKSRKTNCQGSVSRNFRNLPPSHTHKHTHSVSHTNTLSLYLSLSISLSHTLTHSPLPLLLSLTLFHKHKHYPSLYFSCSDSFLVSVSPGSDFCCRILHKYTVKCISLICNLYILFILLSMLKIWLIRRTRSNKKCFFKLFQNDDGSVILRFIHLFLRS